MENQGFLDLEAVESDGDVDSEPGGTDDARGATSVHPTLQLPFPPPRKPTPPHPPVPLTSSPIRASSSSPDIYSSRPVSRAASLNPGSDDGWVPENIPGVGSEAGSSLPPSNPSSRPSTPASIQSARSELSSWEDEMRRIRRRDSYTTWADNPTGDLVPETETGILPQQGQPVDTSPRRSPQSGQKRPTPPSRSRSPAQRSAVRRSEREDIHRPELKSRRGQDSESDSDGSNGVDLDALNVGLPSREAAQTDYRQRRNAVRRQKK